MTPRRKYVTVPMSEQTVRLLKKIARRAGTTPGMVATVLLAIELERWERARERKQR
jgi:hypothetical protein